MGQETARIRNDGTLVAVSLSMSHIVDAEGDVSGVSVIARDVTERRRYEAELRHVADHDSLTGLVNRTRFESELQRVVELAERFNRPFAVLVVDLDNFKYVNDAHGHTIGDEVLRSIGSLLHGSVRETDLVARLGGDEFVVLLSRADADSARVVARSLIAAVRAHEVVIDDERLRMTISVGGAIFDPSCSERHDVLTAADAAMYEAKQAGRDRCIVFSGAVGLRARAQSGQSWRRGSWTRWTATASSCTASRSCASRTATCRATSSCCA